MLRRVDWYRRFDVTSRHDVTSQKTWILACKHLLCFHRIFPSLRFWVVPKMFTLYIFLSCFYFISLFFLCFSSSCLDLRKWMANVNEILRTKSPTKRDTNSVQPEFSLWIVALPSFCVQRNYTVYWNEKVTQNTQKRLQLMASKTNKLNLPSCRLHSLSIEAKEIAFKSSADTYVCMPVSKAMKMARCSGLRKKAYAIVPETYEAVHRNTVRGTPSCVFLQCCVCACACAHESDGTCRKCWGDYTLRVFIMTPRQPSVTAGLAGASKQ